MNIDTVKERFDFEPSDKSAGAYLAVATSCWRGGEICDLEYGLIVECVAEWLFDGDLSEESTCTEIKAAHAADMTA